VSLGAWLVIGIAVVSISVGWPADALARSPGGWGGLGWFAITFVLPAIVWIGVAMIGRTDYDSGDLLYFLGYLASVAGIFVGTILSRVLRNARTRHGPRSANRTLG
jgi:hypothetical protein